MLESTFKSRLKKDLRLIFHDCILIDLDPTRHQGISDLLILFGERWAMLEFKKDINSGHRPNQDYYIEKYNRMGFASFIYPENKKEVLSDLTRYFNY